MVVSKQHHDVTETLPTSIKYIDRKEANAAHAKTKLGLSTPTAQLLQDKHNSVSPVNASRVGVCIVRVATRATGRGRRKFNIIFARWPVATA